jgi:hypothetical protein
MCGMPSLSTARVPSPRTTGATQAQLPSLWAKGSPSVSDQRSCTAPMAAGSWSSQARRSGVALHVSARRSGMISVMK